MTACERIDDLLREKKLSRRKLAIQAGIHPSSFQSAMERNGNITIRMVERIASALDVSPSWLCGWSEESFPDDEKGA